ncbi:MAG: glycosyltransferase family 1 protein, partial [Bacteroidales bacterium]|nr:glycosyltransferase family 1 protein [Bacteroidales bacterium]
MPDKHLHIISFNVPYPPNYGGVIDVFYKLKALHREGVKIHLHCFKYDRATSEKLLNYCVTVNYYNRKTGLLSAVSTKPYIVSSRRSEKLITNLLKDNHPILFEGLHSCYYIDDKRLQSRKKIYRESNIEHLYYYNLFKVEKKLTSK